MTPTQIAQVRESFAAIRPISRTAAAMFFARLFEVDPSLRRQFIGDMEQHGRAFMQALALAVAGLDRGEARPLREFGRRHGCTAGEHDAVLRNALLWTVEQILGGEFTPSVRAAWMAASDLLLARVCAQATAKAA